MTLSACAELVRRGDPDRFLVAMAAPSEARARLLPLYAFNLDIARAPWASTDPNIALMRLQFWRDTLAEIASIDLLYAILERITAEAGRSMASFIAADEAKLAIWRAQVAEVRSSLAQRQATGQARVSAIMQIIEKTAMIENMLAASMSPSMAAALDWSRGMQSRSIVP